MAFLGRLGVSGISKQVVTLRQLQGRLPAGALLQMHQLVATVPESNERALSERPGVSGSAEVQPGVKHRSGQDGSWQRTAGKQVSLQPFWFNAFRARNMVNC